MVYSGCVVEERIYIIPIILWYLSYVYVDMDENTHGHIKDLPYYKTNHINLLTGFRQGLSHTLIYIVMIEPIIKPIILQY